MKLADFLGHWRMEREIVEQGGAVHHLSGTAAFSAAPEGLLYREEGQLVTAQGHSFTASRTYHWRDAGAGQIQVLFEDGRDFHYVDLEGGQPRDQHWCDPDMYHVSYNFEDWPNWSSAWTVLGPRKDYRMVTRYQR